MDRTELFEQHIYLAERLAKKYTNSSIKQKIEYDDLYQEASIALYKASETYNPVLNDSFIPYAVKMIQYGIYEYLRKQNNLYTPRNIVIIAGIINRKNMVDWSASDIAAELNIPKHHIEHALQFFKQPPPKSIFSPIQSAEIGGKTLIDIIPGIENKFLNDIDINAFLYSLDERSKRVLKLRLDGFTQYEIADQIGISQTLVRRILGRIKDAYNIFNESK